MSLLCLQLARDVGFRYCFSIRFCFQSLFGYEGITTQREEQQFFLPLYGGQNRKSVAEVEVDEVG